MHPLVTELAFSHRKKVNSPDRTYLGFIKGITTLQRFVVDRRQIGVDGQPRLRVGSKTIQLGVPGVTSGCTAQDCFRQQGLTPEGYKSLAIEIPWV